MVITHMKVDDRICSLVDAVNAAGAVTTSSCGGHRCPKPGQVPHGEFCVDFCVPRTGKGWAALDAIGRAVMDARHCELQVWHDGGLMFEIRGYGGEDPDGLAKAISRYNI